MTSINIQYPRSRDKQLRRPLVPEGQNGCHSRIVHCAVRDIEDAGEVAATERMEKMDYVKLISQQRFEAPQSQGDADVALLSNVPHQLCPVTNSLSIPVEETTVEVRVLDKQRASTTLRVRCVAKALGARSGEKSKASTAKVLFHVLFVTLFAIFVDVVHIALPNPLHLPEPHAPILLPYAVLTLSLPGLYVSITNSSTRCWRCTAWRRKVEEGYMGVGSDTAVAGNIRGTKESVT
ncbi:hypothetical protein BDQ17DRAFT_1335480 [Cyathus striatus]|nr:hypothetical protein BDQ17DRAFT_1335480 [Cyathus striatus]